MDDQASYSTAAQVGGEVPAEVMDRMSHLAATFNRPKYDCIVTMPDIVAVMEQHIIVPPNTPIAELLRFAGLPVHVGQSRGESIALWLSLRGQGRHPMLLLPARTAGWPEGGVNS